MEGSQEASALHKTLQAIEESWEWKRGSPGKSIPLGCPGSTGQP